MAFQKSLTLPSGVSGNYIRLIAYRWDRNAREANAIFALYLDAQAAHDGKDPLAPCVAKLRLTGSAFDSHASNVAIAGKDILAQLYTAAQSEPMISDFGEDVFVNALDV